MKETPVNKIMENTLEKMREMVDVSTIIGDPMVTGDTTLIPVSKVTYGFTSGGTDLPTKQQNQELFGGGGGGGITITPVAFIVIEKGKCRMMQINNYTSSADRAVSMIPELVDKLTELLKAKDGKADEAETPRGRIMMYGSPAYICVGDSFVCKKAYFCRSLMFVFAGADAGAGVHQRPKRRGDGRCRTHGAV